MDKQLKTKRRRFVSEKSKAGPSPSWSSKASMGGKVAGSSSPVRTASMASSMRRGSRAFGC